MYSEMTFTGFVSYKFYVCLQNKQPAFTIQIFTRISFMGLGVVLSITKRKETTPNGHTMSVH